MEDDAVDVSQHLECGRFECSLACFFLTRIRIGVASIRMRASARPSGSVMHVRDLSGCEVAKHWCPYITPTSYPGVAVICCDGCPFYNTKHTPSVSKLRNRLTTGGQSDSRW